MLKKFLEGLAFGGGFAIAFMIVWVIAASILTSRMTGSFSTSTSQPKFDKPVEAHVITPSAAVPTDQREFSFFKDSRDEMKIPAGGGILAMSPMDTPSGSKRPSTYQLWLTESKLWQIKTTEEKVEVEPLPYPPHASVTDLDNQMIASLGFRAQQSTMTVSDADLRQLRSSGKRCCDDSMNGKLKITDEGVVFVQPNPF